jgi:hypothetical protein
MAFAQLTYRESLRDIEACPRAVRILDSRILESWTPIDRILDTH